MIINYIGEERKPTLWKSMKEFINGFNIGDTITRSELLDYLSSTGFYDSAVSKARWGTSTIDTYRNYLEKAGYLRKLRYGIYKVVEEIPNALTIPEIKEKAYSGYGSYLGALWGSDIWTTSTKYPSKKYKRKKDNGFILEDEFKV
jgi:hypothetical protein